MHGDLRNAISKFLLDPKDEQFCWTVDVDYINNDFLFSGLDGWNEASMLKFHQNMVADGFVVFHMNNGKNKLMHSVSSVLLLVG